MTYLYTIGNNAKGITSANAEPTSTMLRRLLRQIGRTGVGGRRPLYVNRWDAISAGAARGTICYSTDGGSATVASVWRQTVEAER